MNAKTYIYFWNSRAMLLGHSNTAVIHQHYPVEIYLGLNRDFKIDFGQGWVACRSVLIESNVPHRFDSQNDWYVLLFMDPEIDMARRLCETHLNVKPATVLDLDPIKSCMEELQRFTRTAQTCDTARQLFDRIVAAYAGEGEPLPELDPRIKEVRKILEDMPEKKASIKNIAQQVYLSESRLTHLFKEQTGIPLSRYILYMRLMEAVKCVFYGEDLTTAAHHAGFADSAHLSRTYKQIFGLKPSEFFNSYSDRNVTEIIVCPEN